MVKFAEEMGAKVIAVCDVKGGMYNCDGISYQNVKEQIDNCGTVCGLEGCKSIDRDEVITSDCDILIPAAMENAISSKNAHDVKAKLIVEAANGPLTPEATEILNKKGAIIIPDILANSGGVTVSYFEWVQNNEGYYWTEEEVSKKLEDKMVKAFNKVYNIAQEKEINMRLAAYIAGTEKVVEAMRLRGWL
jgi:glutamate dehydrogenase